MDLATFATPPSSEVGATEGHLDQAIPKFRLCTLVLHSSTRAASPRYTQLANSLVKDHAGFSPARLVSIVYVRRRLSRGASSAFLPTTIQPPAVVILVMRSLPPFPTEADSRIS